MKVLFVRSGNNGPDPITNFQGDALIAAGCNIEYFDILGKGLIGYCKNIFRLRERVKKGTYDLIHAHYAFSGILASISFLEKPVVTSLMGSDINYSGRLLISLIRIFSKFIWKATIVKTKKLNQLIYGPRVYIISNGVNLNLFRPENKLQSLSKLSWSADNYNVLFGSDPDRLEKNFKLSLSSLNLIREDFPNIQLHLLKGINKEEVYLYYNAADALLLTSENEGSPNVIKEAMACNCPIIATDVGDIKEVIGDTEGCYVTGFSKEEIADKLKQVLTKKERTNGRTKIAHLDSKITSNKIVRIYDKILEKKQ